MHLEELRFEIDSINLQIAQLILQRLKILSTIKKIKLHENIPPYDEKRTSQMLDDLEKFWRENQAIEDPDWEKVRPLFSTLFQISLEHMKKNN